MMWHFPPILSFVSLIQRPSMLQRPQNIWPFLNCRAPFGRGSQGHGEASEGGSAGRYWMVTVYTSYVLHMLACTMRRLACFFLSAVVFYSRNQKLGVGLLTTNCNQLAPSSSRH